jgi:ribosomal protein L11 methylase PrmA
MALPISIKVTIIISVTLGLIYFYLPFLFGAPYLPSNRKETTTIVSFAKKYSKKKNPKAIDLGSGNGKIILALSKSGIKSKGFEINPFLLWLTKLKIKLMKSKLKNQVSVSQRNFMLEDLSKYDIITIFQTNKMMKKLEGKLQKELKKGSIVISNEWKFPNWKIIRQEGQIYLYRKE